MPTVAGRRVHRHHSLAREFGVGEIRRIVAAAVGHRGLDLHGIHAGTRGSTGAKTGDQCRTTTIRVTHGGANAQRGDGDQDGAALKGHSVSLFLWCGCMVLYVLRCLR